MPTVQIKYELTKDAVIDAVLVKFWNKQAEPEDIVASETLIKGEVKKVTATDVVNVVVSAMGPKGATWSLVVEISTDEGETYKKLTSAPIKRTIPKNGLSKLNKDYSLP